jgi:hypothetical protein
MRGVMAMDKDLIVDVQWVLNESEGTPFIELPVTGAVQWLSMAIDKRNIHSRVLACNRRNGNGCGWKH